MPLWTWIFRRHACRVRLGAACSQGNIGFTARGECYGPCELSLQVSLEKTRINRISQYRGATWLFRLEIILLTPFVPNGSGIRIEI